MRDIFVHLLFFRPGFSSQTREFIEWIQSGGTTSPKFLRLTNPENDENSLKRTKNRSKCLKGPKVPKLRLKAQKLGLKSCDNCHYWDKNTTLLEDGKELCWGCIHGQEKPVEVLDNLITENGGVLPVGNDLERVIKQTNLTKERITNLFFQRVKIREDQDYEIENVNIEDGAEDELERMIKTEPLDQSFQVTFFNSK